MVQWSFRTLITARVTIEHTKTYTAQLVQTAPVFVGIQHDPAKSYIFLIISVYLTLLKQYRSPPDASPSAKRRAKNHKSLQNSGVAKVLALFRMETHVHILYKRIFGCKDSYFAANITLNIFMYDYKDWSVCILYANWVLGSTVAQNVTWTKQHFSTSIFQKLHHYQFPHVPWSKVAIVGMVIPPSIGILIMGPYKPLRTWVDEFIPYYMEIMGVVDPGTHVHFYTQPPGHPALNQTPTSPNALPLMASKALGRIARQ